MITPTLRKSVRNRAIRARNWIDTGNQIVLAFAREWGPDEIRPDHAMTKPLAILVGFIGKVPFAGIAVEAGIDEANPAIWQTKERVVLDAVLQA